MSNARIRAFNLFGKTSIQRNFPLKTHIGIPPLIGTDGIIYGPFETLDMAPIDITPANENMEWTTEVTVPNDVKGFYVLLSVESRKPRTYVNYALDISDE